MEGFLYTLVSSFVCALAFIAYRHPETYATYVSIGVVGVSLAAMIAMAGYFAGNLVALAAASDALAGKDAPFDQFAKVTAAIRGVELPAGLWLGNISLMAYVYLLGLLPRLNLTASSSNTSS